MTPLERVLQGYADQALIELGEERAPRRVVPVAPGISPAWDDPCGGQLFGRVVQMQPGVEKQPGGAGVRCGVHFWVVTLAVGLVRCAATLDNKGNAPKASEVFADGQEMLDDMVAVQAAILHPDMPTRSVVGWTPLEEEGGAHGGEWVFTVRLDLTPPPGQSGPAGLGG